MEKERRKDERFVIDQLFEISFTREKLVSAKGLNISKGGILCEVDESLELSSTAFLMLTLKQTGGNYSFSCEGIIIRCEKKGNTYLAAIQFTDLTTEQENHIKKLIK